MTIRENCFKKAMNYAPQLCNFGTNKKKTKQQERFYNQTLLQTC